MLFKDRQIGLAQKLGVLSLFLMVLLGPFYWLPGVSSKTIFVFKISMLGLFMSATILKFATSNHKFYLSKASIILFFPLLFSIVAVSLIQGAKFPFTIVYQTIVSWIILNVGYNFAKIRSFEVGFMGLNKGFMVFAYGSLMAVTSVLILLSLLTAPSFLINPFIEDRYFNQASISGFGAGRTGWSVGLLFIAIFIYYSCADWLNEHNLAKVLLFIVTTIPILVPGGRGGGLFYLAFLTFFLLNEGRTNGKSHRIYINIVLIFISALVVLFLAQEFDIRLFTSFSSVQEGDFTTGRADGYWIGLKFLGQNPFGVGSDAFTLYDYGFSYSNVHNEFLKIAIQYGLIPAFWFYAFILGLLINRISYYRNLDLPCRTAVWLILAAFWISLLEPTSFIGNAQQNLVLWFFIGVLFAYRSVTVQHEPIDKRL